MSSGPEKKVNPGEERMFQSADLGDTGLTPGQLNEPYTYSPKVENSDEWVVDSDSPTPIDRQNKH